MLAQARGGFYTEGGRGNNSFPSHSRPSFPSVFSFCAHYLQVATRFQWLMWPTITVCGIGCQWQLSFLSNAVGSRCLCVLARWRAWSEYQQKWWSSGRWRGDVCRRLMCSFRHCVLRLKSEPLNSSPHIFSHIKQSSVPSVVSHLPQWLSNLLSACIDFPVVWVILFQWWTWILWLQCPDLGHIWRGAYTPLQWP